MRVPTKLRRHSILMPTGAILSSPSLTYPLTTHQHLGTMRTSHMGKEHSKVKDLDRICSKYHASHGFQQQQQQQQQQQLAGQRAKNQGQRRSNSFKGHMLAFMGENKRLLNIHEKNFAELAIFQGKHNCVLGQYQCLFEEYGDSCRAASSSHAESAQGCIPK